MRMRKVLVVRGNRTPMLDLLTPTERRVGLLLAPAFGGPKGLAIGVIKLELGARTEPDPPHRIPEPIFVVYGLVEVVLGEGRTVRRVRLRAGDVGVIPPGVHHLIRNIGRMSAEVLFFYAPAGPERGLVRHLKRHLDQQRLAARRLRRRGPRD